MPTVQALDRGGRAIFTLSNVSQHAESLGFNPSEPQRQWVSADWVHFFRQRIEQRFGGVAIEMAGSVGSVETPEVFPGAISSIPQRHIDESHPAGCRTLFDPNGTPAVPGYHLETTALGNTLASAVNDALLRNAQASRSSTIWGARRDICVPLTNQFFAIGANIGVFAERPGYGSDCTVKFPVAANGSTSGDELKSQVAAFRIGDGSFITVPGEVFPFTYLRGFLGPNDMPHSQYKLPPWPLPHMTTRYRFIDGLGEDMLGYIFPRGNGVGVPGENGNSSILTTPTASGAATRTTRSRPARRRATSRLGPSSGCSTSTAARRGWFRAGTSFPTGRGRGTRWVAPRSSATWTPPSTSPAGRSACGSRARAWSTRKRGCRSTAGARCVPIATRAATSRRAAAGLGGRVRPPLGRRLRRPPRHRTSLSWRAMPTETETAQLWICTSCGFIYDPDEGDPDGGIPPGTPFDQIPDDWFCPVCGARKADFEPYEE